jgi:hypothetical protein
VKAYSYSSTSENRPPLNEISFRQRMTSGSLRFQIMRWRTGPSPIVSKVRLRILAAVVGWGDLSNEAAVREFVRNRPFVRFRRAQAALP